MEMGGGLLGRRIGRPDEALHGARVSIAMLGKIEGSEGGEGVVFVAAASATRCSSMRSVR